MMNAGTAGERAMKRGLDGTFTRLETDGRIKTVWVRADYVPSYENMFVPRDYRASRSAAQRRKRPYVEEDDARIIAMRRAGLTMRHIGIALGRHSGSIGYRAMQLRRMGLL